MKKTFTFLLTILLCFQLISQDTFSIIAVDSITGEVGAAGATCVDGIAAFGGIQVLNDIIPGKGGVNAQAWICLNPHVNLVNAIAQMNNGLSPAEIISWLQENDNCSAQNFNHQYRQYGVVDFDSNGSPRVAAFTGANADDYKGHRTGADYSIQGNILLGAEVLDGMEAGFTNTQGTLAEKLMAAMQGANIPGADSRCLARGTSSTSAFLRVYKSDDAPGNPFLELSILEMPFGQEPIDSLQNLFSTWFSTSTENLENKIGLKTSIFPNPTQNILEVSFEINSNINLQLEIYNTVGKLMLEKKVQVEKNAKTEFDVQQFSEGIYFLEIKTEAGHTQTMKFIKI